MVERHLAKVDVAGSNPVSRSIFFALEQVLKVDCYPSTFCREDLIYAVSVWPFLVRGIEFSG